MSKGTAEKGYRCTCGASNLFDSYVYAHWNNILTGECKKCGRKVKVQMGRAYPPRRRKNDPQIFEPIR